MPTNDLIDYMHSATKQMNDDYLLIQKRAAEDPGTAGDQAEENWAKLLRNWLPHTFHVVTKGRIINSQGIASPQVDVLILAPEYPPGLLQTKLYLSAGVLAAFECKLTLKAVHITDFMNTSLAIKGNFQGDFTNSPYSELQSRIIFGLLSHSHSWKRGKSNPIQTIQDKLDLEDRNIITHPRLMPDILCVADLACWSASKIVYYENPLNHYTGKKFGTIYDSEEEPMSCYTCHSLNSSNRLDGSSPIGSMITTLSFKLAYRTEALRTISGYYIFTGIKAKGIGKAMRHWSHNIFSEHLKNKIITTSKSKDFWDEWGPFID